MRSIRGTRAIALSVATFVSVLISAACGKAHEELPAVNESGIERGEELPRNDNKSTGKRIVISQVLNARYEKAGVLEFKAELPTGTEIDVSPNYQIFHMNYRGADGKLERSSTGFLTPITVIAVPAANSAQFPKSRIDDLNSTPGGLFVSASIIGGIEGTEGDFGVIQGIEPGAGFLKNYHPTGQPRFNHTNAVKARFGARLDKGVDPSSLSASDRAKWQRIYAELKTAADRTVATPKAYLMIDHGEAVKWSIEYEKTGAISPFGAWMIAVEGTAVRHGFPNVPCAEFQSEMLKQAYKRAGFQLTDDFNQAKGNPIIWSKTAAVFEFSKALYAAGWIPWDTSKFRAPTGAFLMHGAGKTPGHTYIAGGDDGRIIVDNSAPQGRDLRKTTDKTTELMYMGGVFFLPPGINPQPW